MTHSNTNSTHRETVAINETMIETAHSSAILASQSVVDKILSATSPPKVIWEGLSLLHNYKKSIPIGYDGMPKFTLNDNHPI